MNAKGKFLGAALPEHDKPKQVLNSGMKSAYFGFSFTQLGNINSYSSLLNVCLSLK